ncbi:hypothetical protein B0H11DRAFT_898957 [Mycena galericulata]|nr:hypothetical protein B0H11DRAFT_898957 [Mycena galericulata]
MRYRRRLGVRLQLRFWHSYRRRAPRPRSLRKSRARFSVELLPFARVSPALRQPHAVRSRLICRPLQQWTGRARPLPWTLHSRCSVSPCFYRAHPCRCLVTDSPKFRSSSPLPCLCAFGLWVLPRLDPRPYRGALVSISSYSPAVAPTWPRHDAPRYDPNVITPMSSPFSQLDVRGRGRAQPDGG